MSAIYDLFETPSPNKEEKQPLHARIVSKGTVDKEEFLDRVHKFTGISYLHFDDLYSLRPCY